jgi:type II secretory pathway pseudopilin PulG
MIESGDLPSSAVILPPSGQPVGVSHGAANGAVRSSRSAGFTIVELVVSALIASVLLGAIYQVLVTNQRVSVVQREQVTGHETVRAGIDLLTQELREVSAGGGDLLTIGDDSVSFRALRAHGVACVVGSEVTPELRVAVMTRPFVDGETLYVFADLDPETEADDAWLETTIQGVEGDQTCGADNHAAQNLTVTGFDAAEWARIRQGAPVRSWEEVEYAVEDFSGVPYLVRIEGESVGRLVGPLSGENGLHFEFLDANGDPTANALDVRTVEVELRTNSVAHTEAGEAIGDSLTTAVQLRN